MRLIVGISLLLLGFGTLLCQVDVLRAKAPELAAESSWVRTVDGWERHGSWNPEMPAGAPVHPLILATGQMLASVLALAVFKSHGRTATRWKCC